LVKLQKCLLDLVVIEQTFYDYKHKWLIYVKYRLDMLESFVFSIAVYDRKI